MGNLIDRELLIKKLDEHCNTVCQYPKSVRYVMCAGCPLGTAFDVMDEMPSAETEIIRCNECKHNPNITWFECPMSHLSESQRPETAWCWKAERRTDEHSS